MGQHGALQEVQDSLRPDENLFAYFNDIHVVCPLPSACPPSLSFWVRPSKRTRDPDASGQDASLETRRPRAPRV